MAKEPPFIFIDNTPERRTGVFQLKLMFDEAYRLRDEYDLAGYADQVAAIKLAYLRLNPTYADTNWEKAEESAAFTRSVSLPQYCPDAEQTKKNFDFLDDILRIEAQRLISFEKQLRMGLENKLKYPSSKLFKFI
jgi:hypothetical protein